jgi:cytoskeletal protein RodZ
MIHNKKFIIGCVVVIILGGIGIAALLLNRPATPDNTSTTTDTTAEQTSDAPLEIENFSSYEDISITTKATIRDAIDHYLADTPHTTDPIGIIRDGSYKKTPDGTITVIEFLVDIASLKRSYKINFSTDSSTDQQTLYTLCPAKNELIYPPFNCKDDLSEV